MAKKPEAAKEEKRPANRPPKVPYSDEIAEKIFEMMATGHDVVETCELLGIPARTFYNWQDQHPEFGRLCVRAREALADYDAKRIRQVVESLGTQTGLPADLARVKVAGLQWFAERRAPRFYGNKTSTEITGKDGGAIKTEATSKVDWRELDPDQRETVRQALLAAKVAVK